jgi:hypothetical protein
MKQKVKLVNGDWERECDTCNQVVQNCECHISKEEKHSGLYKLVKALFKSSSMNKEQKSVVDEYVEKYGGVNIVEHKTMVQLQLDRGMVKMEGINAYWIKRFDEVFTDVIIGPLEGEKYSIYISLIK